MNRLEIKRILFTEDMLKARISELGKQISRDYDGKDLILVGVLKGSLYFLSDLTRAVTIPIWLDLISIGVYPNSTGKTGIVRISKDLDIDITGKHVLIIEDIIRTGLTTGYLVSNLRSRMPADVKICTLLNNPSQQLINIPIEYTGFTVSTEWLVGYGLDIGERWRNLPYIAEIENAKE